MKRSVVEASARRNRARRAKAKKPVYGARAYGSLLQQLDGVKLAMQTLRSMIDGVSEAEAAIHAEFRRRIERLESGKRPLIKDVRVLIGTMNGPEELVVDGLRDEEDGRLTVMCNRMNFQARWPDDPKTTLAPGRGT